MVKDLSKQIEDLKMLVNGDLSKKASEDLTRTSLQVQFDIKALGDSVNALSLALALSKNQFDVQIDRFKQLIKWGWVIFILSAVGTLCVIAYHVH